MITNIGAQKIQRVVADNAATNIAVGVGTAAESAADTSLEFEILRLPIESVSVDYVADNAIYKTTLPGELSASIREVGLVNDPVCPNVLVADFSSDGTDWTVGTHGTSNARVGAETLRVNPAISATANSVGGVSLDLSEVSQIIVAYHVATAASSMSIRLRTDASNYYSAALTATTGYKIVKIDRASGLSVTGAPTSIDSIELVVTSTGGASADVYFDAVALRVGSVKDDLVARDLLGAAQAKVAGKALELEYSVGIAI